VVNIRLGAALLCLFTAVVGAQRNDELLVQAGRFVQTTLDQLSGVIADENYIQEVYGPPFDSGIRPRIGRRSIRSDAMFLWLPSAHEWMFVRNVVAVDGSPVPDSADRWEGLLRDPTADVVATLRQIQQENARFDLGPVIRTLGDPTFALRYLEPNAQPRFTFPRVGTERIDGVRATVLPFSERRRPFVVKVNGMDAPSSGTMWVNAADGSVVRTSLRVAFPSGRTAALITVDFHEDNRLKIWAPWKMSEQYNTMNGESTTASASYDNFRRFDVSVRVITPDAQK
jgi:hypothetical protein